MWRRVGQQHFSLNPEIKSCISISKVCLMHPPPLSTNMSVYITLTGAALQLCSSAAGSQLVLDPSATVAIPNFAILDLKSVQQTRNPPTAHRSWQLETLSSSLRFKILQLELLWRKDHEECDFTTISDVWLLASMPMSVAEREVNKLRGEWWKLALP